MDEQSPLEKYGIDLTAQVGRQEVEDVHEVKVNQVIQALCRRIKNSPLILGEASAARSVADSLARRIVNEEVPENLLHKRLIALNIEGLLAEPDEIENRLQAFMKAAVQKAGELILFVPEVQLIFDIEITSPLDIGFSFTRAVRQGEIQVIGVTTVEQLHLAAEKNSALIYCFRGSKIQIP